MTIQDKLDRAAAGTTALLAVLVDPDKEPAAGWPAFAAHITASGADLVLVGGSLLMTDHFERVLSLLKDALNIPVVIFPGNAMQVSAAADAILLLSLISGRNADLLIGQHVHAAPLLKRSGLEVLPTGYLLVDGGRSTTVSYISNTLPIPADKPGIAASTALAGQYLGLRNIYLEAGSGALRPVPAAMVSAVCQQVNLPVFAGGGIRDAATAAALVRAGATVIVIGTAFEENPEIMGEIAAAVHRPPAE